MQTPQETVLNSAIPYPPSRPARLCQRCRVLQATWIWPTVSTIPLVYCDDCLNKDIARLGVALGGQ